MFTYPGLSNFLSFRSPEAADDAQAEFDKIFQGIF